MYQSVVRIFATTQSPDYESPWQSRPPSNSTGSGVIIDGNRILTGAHVIANATFLQVQKVSDPDKVVAHVEAVCHDCDLALLRVDKPKFMNGVEPAQFGELPRLRDRVSVVGYPVGGEEISITEGVVSRIEVQKYSHSERQLLAVTVDAAINDGNSGGPVCKDGKVVGIAFQTLDDAENIGEVVPISLIQNFLNSTSETQRTSVPGFGVVTQNLENPQLRQQAGLSNGQSGVLVVTLEEGGSAWGQLQVGDALLAIDDYPIANNGTIRYRDNFRTSFDVFLGEHHEGDHVTAEVLRDGKVHKLDVELKPYCTLVPRSQYDSIPTYFIFGGMVFQPLSLDLLRTWSEWWDKAPPELLNFYYSGTRSEAKQEVVVLSQVLADDLNVGYEDLDNATVRQVNGQTPRNMRHFVDLVESAEKDIEIQLSDDCRVVLDASIARDAQGRILKRYRISADRSVDLGRA